MTLEEIKEKYCIDVSMSRLSAEKWDKYIKNNPNAGRKASDRERAKQMPSTQRELNENYEELTDLSELQKFFEKIAKFRIPKIKGSGAVVKGIQGKCENIKNLAASGVNLIKTHIDQRKKLRGIDPKREPYWKK